MMKKVKKKKINIYSRVNCYRDSCILVSPIPPPCLRHEFVLCHVGEAYSVPSRAHSTPCKCIHTSTPRRSAITLRKFVRFCCAVLQSQNVSIRRYSEYVISHVTKSNIMLSYIGWGALRSCVSQFIDVPSLM